MNLPQIGILAEGDEEKFWSLLEERLALCFEALMCRHHALEGTLSNVSPIHWQYGAIARLKPGETIDKLLHNGYSTISLGYIGLYEVTKLMTGVSHTDPKGTDFALRLMKRLRLACDTWKLETGIGFGLYGTPAESLCYRFAEIDKKRFGVIADVTDKGYYTNSYHVDVREKIDAFEKFTFESQFQNISSVVRSLMWRFQICGIIWRHWKMWFALSMITFSMRSSIRSRITVMCVDLMVRSSLTMIWSGMPSVSQ